MLLDAGQRQASVSPVSPPKSLQEAVQESPLFQNCGCSRGEAPRQVLQGLDWAPGSRGRKRHGSFNDEKWVFYISAESLLLLHLSAEEGREQQRTGAGSRA